MRERLVAAGIAVLERDGLGMLSLREIAREAGVSHGAPRRWFPTYASLLAAIARQGLLDLDTLLDLDDLPAAARAYLDFAGRRPEMFALITRHDLLAGAGGDLRGVVAPWFATVATRLGSPEQALALWSGVHGLAVLTSRRATDALAAVGAPDPDAALDVLLARLGRE